MLSFETINPQKTAQHAVIWLHGLGADGYDFMPIVPELNLEDKAIRFIFPHAPHRPVTLNKGMHMPAWFDIHELSSLTAKQDEEGIEESYQAICELIEAQHAQGIPYQQIALIGFSQGGALALYTALRFPQLLAGAMGLSTYLPLVPMIKAAIREPKSLPIFLAHGTHDPVVPLEAGQMTHELLTTQGFTVDWHTYVAMAHQVCTAEIKDMSQWLSNIFS